MFTTIVRGRTGLKGLKFEEGEVQGTQHEAYLDQNKIKTRPAILLCLSTCRFSHRGVLSFGGRITRSVRLNTDDPPLITRKGDKVLRISLTPRDQCLRPGWISLYNRNLLLGQASFIREGSVPKVKRTSGSKYPPFCDMIIFTCQRQVLR